LSVREELLACECSRSLLLTRSFSTSEKGTSIGERLSSDLKAPSKLVIQYLQTLSVGLKGFKFYAPERFA